MLPFTQGPHAAPKPHFRDVLRDDNNHALPAIALPSRHLNRSVKDVLHAMEDKRSVDSVQKDEAFDAQQVWAPQLDQFVQPFVEHSVFERMVQRNGHALNAFVVGGIERRLCGFRSQPREVV